MVSTCYTASGDQLVRLPWLEEGVSVEKRLWQRLAIRRNDNKCERVSYPVRVILWMESQMLKHIGLRKKIATKIPGYVAKSS